GHVEDPAGHSQETAPAELLPHGLGRDLRVADYQGLAGGRVPQPNLGRPPLAPRAAESAPASARRASLSTEAAEPAASAWRPSPPPGPSEASAQPGAAHPAGASEPAAGEHAHATEPRAVNRGHGGPRRRQDAAGEEAVTKAAQQFSAGQVPDADLA